MKLLNSTMIVLGFCLVGCGQSAPAPNTKDPAAEKTVGAKEDLKKVLQSIAESGSGGSGLMGIKESIDKAVRPSDAKLADDLTKDFGELSGTQDAAKIKEVATRMAGKL